MLEPPHAHANLVLTVDPTDIVDVEYGAAPDLFCLDLYKEFDLDRLAALAAPARIVTQ